MHWFTEKLRKSNGNEVAFELLIYDLVQDLTTELLRNLKFITTTIVLEKRVISLMGSCKVELSMTEISMCIIIEKNHMNISKIYIECLI